MLNLHVSLKLSEFYFLLLIIAKICQAIHFCLETDSFSDFAIHFGISLQSWVLVRLISLPISFLINSMVKGFDARIVLYPGDFYFEVLSFSTRFL